MKRPAQTCPTCLREFRPTADRKKYCSAACHERRGTDDGAQQDGRTVMLSGARREASPETRLTYAGQAPQAPAAPATPASLPTPPARLENPPALCECGAAMRAVRGFKRCECSAECGRPGWWVKPGGTLWERMPTSVPRRSER